MEIQMLRVSIIIMMMMMIAMEPARSADGRVAAPTTSQHIYVDADVIQKLLKHLLLRSYTQSHA